MSDSDTSRCQSPGCINASKPPEKWASCFYDGSPCQTERWAIHKASRTYDGGTYLGPSLDAADVKAGPYDTEAEAQEIADKLLLVNHVGWRVVPYRPRGN